MTENEAKYVGIFKNIDFKKKLYDLKKKKFFCHKKNVIKALPKK